MRVELIRALRWIHDRKAWVGGKYEQRLPVLWYLMIQFTSEHLTLQHNPLCKSKLRVNQALAICHPV